MQIENICGTSDHLSEKPFPFGAIWQTGVVVHIPLLTPSSDVWRKGRLCSGFWAEQKPMHYYTHLSCSAKRPHPYQEAVVYWLSGIPEKIWWVAASVGRWAVQKNAKTL